MEFKGKALLLPIVALIAIGAYLAAPQSSDSALAGPSLAASPESSPSEAKGVAESGEMEVEKKEIITLANGMLAIAPPPISSDVFPCSDCHDPEPDMDTSRTNELFHEDVVLNHDGDSMWCYSCHNGPNREMLHLSSGETLPLSESYRLCGQCHSDEYKNWIAGDHGKRTGSWSGVKEYRVCSSCHDAHDPHVQSMEPLPAPIRQELIR